MRKIKLLYLRVKTANYVWILVLLLFAPVIFIYLFNVPYGKEEIHNGQVLSIGLWGGSQYEWPADLAQVKLANGVLVKVGVPRSKKLKEGQSIKVIEQKLMLKGSFYKYATN